MTRCKACPATWTGLGIAHCASCHETFTTVSNFDRHRAGSRVRGLVAGECNAPDDAGLVLNERGQWAMPGREAVA
jgi:hypothetical protein